MSRISKLTEMVKGKLLEARKIKYEVGGFVRDPDGQMALEINGKPYASVEVYPDGKNGKDIVFITLHGKTLFVRPTGENNSITPEDMDKIKEDVLAILYDKPTKYYGREQEELHSSVLSTEPVLNNGERIIVKKSFTDYQDMLEYIADNTIEDYDFENLGWNFPDEDNSAITEFSQNGKPVYFTWIPNNARVKYQWAETDDYVLYVIQSPSKEKMKQGSLFTESMAKKVNKILEELRYTDMPKLEDCADEIDFLRKSWNYFNDKLFQGKLTEPKFKIFNARLTADKGMAGSYRPDFDDDYNVIDRELSIGRQYIALPDVFEEILIHEMCHQAVEEIDEYSHNLAQRFKEEARELYDEDSKYFNWAWKGKFRKSSRAHGKEWKAWARKCGIAASTRTTWTPEMGKLRQEAERQQAEKRKQGKEQFSLFR